MRILDAYPDRATYLPGATTGISIELVNDSTRRVSGQLAGRLVSLDRTLAHKRRRIRLTAQEHKTISLKFPLPLEDFRGYGIEISFTGTDGRILATAHTALDVCSDWRRAPRYGFLSDFAPGETDSPERIQSLARYHLNALQFYDWMYRHHSLVPSTDTFQDALGRTLSLETVRRKLELAHQQGIQALAYTAVYAAGPEFWREHREWGLYDAQGKPFMLGDFLNIMNLADPAWAEHFRAECVRAVQRVGFDGIHLDQYGYPREGYDAEGNYTNVEIALAPFLDSVADAIGARPTVFNAVNAWGVEAAASSRVAPLYIEVWSPNDTYRDIREIILRARQLRDGQTPVIAAYIEAFRSPDAGARRGAVHALRLLTAAIYLNGGSHIVLGERDGVLCDPYFPKYAHLSPAAIRMLRADYDFIARYMEYFFYPAWRDVSATHTGGINQEVRVATPRSGPFAQDDSVWTVVRERNDELTIGLVNLRGNDAVWNAPKKAPRTIRSLKLELNLQRRITSAFYVTPGQTHPHVLDVPNTTPGTTTLTLRKLEVWGLVVLRLGQSTTNS